MRHERRRGGVAGRWRDAGRDHPDQPRIRRCRARSTRWTLIIDADASLITAHSTIINLFELGVRMAKELPIALVRAKGTNPVFDVDNLLRVESYNPNLWMSTVEKDLPRLSAHIQEAWSR